MALKTLLKREREKKSWIFRTIHFSIFSFVNFSGYVLSSPSIDPFTWPSARSNFSLDAKKSIISIFIDDVFKNYDPLNETSEIGLLIPTSGRFFTSSTIKCHARAKWSTKELTRQRRGRSCRSKENKNKTFPLEKKEHTVERGKFANYAHLSLIILYFLLPSLLPYNNKHTFAEFPVSVLRRHGG